jgi:hypothetical protein
MIRSDAESDWRTIVARCRVSDDRERLTACIRYRDLHPLAPRIPQPRLAECHRRGPLLGGTPTLAGSARPLACQLWHEQQQRMVSFAAARSPSR